MSVRRTMAVSLALFRQIALLIPRWRLRRIAGIRGRFLTLFQLHLQRFQLRLQFGDLSKLCKHQFDQFVSAHLSHIILGHCYPILSNLAIFA
jgi:hypothetical protein